MPEVDIPANVQQSRIWRAKWNSKLASFIYEQRKGKGDMETGAIIKGIYKMVNWILHGQDVRPLAEQEWMEAAVHRNLPIIDSEKRRYEVVIVLIEHVLRVAKHGLEQLLEEERREEE